VVGYLGNPRVLLRNPTLPDEEKFESGLFPLQQTFKYLDTHYTAAIPWEAHPQNPSFNGGIDVATGMLDWSAASGNANNSSVVAFYRYAGWLFVMPGDIEESGWLKL